MPLPTGGVVPDFDMTASLAGEIRVAAGDLVSGFTLGAAIGTVVAYRRLQRGGEIDVFSVVTRWSVAGAVVLPCVLISVR